MKKSYFSASILNASASVITKAIAFVMIAILTRLISKENYGEYSLFSAWVNIVALIIGGSIASSFGIAKKDFGSDYKWYLNSALGLSYLLLFIGVVLFGTFNWSQSKLFLFLVVFHSFNMNILTCYDVRQIFDFQFISAARVTVLTAVISSIAVVSAVYVTSYDNKGIIAIIALTISYALVSLFCQNSFYKSFKALYNKKYWLYAAQYSFIMVPHNLSLVVLNQMDRIMISELLSNSYVAIYSVIYSLSMVISILWTAVKKVWVTWAYDRLAEQNYGKIVYVNHCLMAVMAILVVNYCYISPEIIKVFLQDGYWDGIDIMAPILFGYFFSFLFSIYVNIEYFHKKGAGIVIGTILAATVNIITNYIFIKQFGYKASAYTTLLSYFLLFLYHYIINFRNNYLHTSKIIYVSAFLFLSLGLFQLLIAHTAYRLAVLTLLDVVVFIAIKILAEKHNINLVQALKALIKK